MSEHADYIKEYKVVPHQGQVGATDAGESLERLLNEHSRGGGFRVVGVVSMSDSGLVIMER